MAPGMNHQLGNLACLLREADALGRLAVLPPLRLSAAHNFGVARAWCWETYFDLAASRLVAADGEEHSLPLARRPVGGTERPFVLAPGERLPDGARDRCVVERYVYSDVQARDVPELAGAAPQFKLVPSARVRALARPVIAVLREGGCFAAVHVRRGDRRYGPLRWLTRPARIAGRLRALWCAGGCVGVRVVGRARRALLARIRSHSWIPLRGAACRRRCGAGGAGSTGVGLSRQLSALRGREGGHAKRDVALGDVPGSRPGSGRCRARADAGVAGGTDGAPQLVGDPAAGSPDRGRTRVGGRAGGRGTAKECSRTGPGLLRRCRHRNTSDRFVQSPVTTL